jgi:hypothetical protein
MKFEVRVLTGELVSSDFLIFLIDFLYFGAYQPR